MAVNRRFSRQGDTDTDFFNCTAFGKQAEFVEKYFKQGSRMLLTGRVQNDNYTNKNGERVYSVQIMADEIEFAERKSTADANASRGASNFGGGAPEPAMAADDDFMNIPDGIEDGLPFN
ncbi:MAG: single-stranded DNA-binding protein [Eubacterium sp.]